LSNGAIIRNAASTLESLSSMLPSVAARTSEVALHSKGRGGRTRGELGRLRLEAENLGYEAGLARGIDEGIAKGIAESSERAYEEAALIHAEMLAQFQEDLAAVVESVQSAVFRWSESSEQQITDLVTTIARSVLVSELKISRESILAIVKDALLQVTHSKKARIRVNPYDLPTMRDAEQELMACAASLRTIEFVDDPSIVAGCVIETEGGVIDATMDTKLASLDEELDAG
jgi:flagellar biosynthesis/type III secretory pathway protein FliH